VTASEKGKEAVLDIVAKLCKMPRDQIRPEMNLVADLGIDSPKALQLLAELEDTLGIEISDDAAARMDTVGDVLGFFEGTGGAAPRGAAPA
jgi:acyl carrier protein